MTNRLLTIEGKDLSDALQYGPTPGLTNFREFLTELQETVHKRPRAADWSVAVGTGSQDCMVRVGPHPADARRVLTESASDRY